MKLEGEPSFMSTKHVYVYVYTYYVPFPVLGSLYIYIKFNLFFTTNFFVCVHFIDEGIGAEIS